MTQPTVFENWGHADLVEYILWCHGITDEEQDEEQEENQEEGEESE